MTLPHQLIGFFVLFVEWVCVCVTGYYHAAKAGLKFVAILLPLPPSAGFKVCTTMPSLGCLLLSNPVSHAALNILEKRFVNIQSQESF